MLTVFTLVDALGFGAAAATLATFAQSRMLPMRISAVAANLLFMSYGALGPFYPVLLLHALLLPLNLWRLAPVLSWRLLLSAEASLLQQWREGNEPVSAVIEHR